MKNVLHKFVACALLLSAVSVLAEPWYQRAWRGTGSLFTAAGSRIKANPVISSVVIGGSALGLTAFATYRYNKSKKMGILAKENDTKKQESSTSSSSASLSSFLTASSSHSSEKKADKASLENKNSSQEKDKANNKDEAKEDNKDEAKEDNTVLDVKIPTAAGLLGVKPLLIGLPISLSLYKLASYSMRLGFEYLRPVRTVMPYVKDTAVTNTAIWNVGYRTLFGIPLAISVGGLGWYGAKLLYERNSRRS